MHEQEYIINKRFFIAPALNVLKDLETDTEIRLEPRLMNLLCLLSENRRKVVSREYLIKEVWDDYGGADEGLSQAIFFLRKALLDEKKELIETIPKKGYILHAAISHNKGSIKKNKRKPLLLILIGIVLICTGYFIFFPVLKPEEISSPNEMETRDIEADFPVFNEGDEENYQNTITTVDSNGIRYKLVLIGDRRPKFYIDEQLVEIEDHEKYLPLIDKLRTLLQERRANETP